MTALSNMQVIRKKEMTMKSQLKANSLNFLQENCLEECGENLHFGIRAYGKLFVMST